MPGSNTNPLIVSSSVELNLEAESKMQETVDLIIAKLYPLHAF